MELCYCGSQKKYEECCKPIIHEEKSAETAEELMRARYTAYVVVNVDFIINSTIAAKRDNLDRDAIKKWAESAKWLGFEILNTNKGGKEDKNGSVEFIAKYKEDNVYINHHEIAFFRKYRDKWYYEDSEFPKPKSVVKNEPEIGRNDPCPCGSGKKYKKCCGRKA